ncbi:hypothetical protein NST04_19555 [Paenibacillus sp. FSL H7-0756]|uniref:hypothetical protein n=1 Tax=Paenibacillus sp. FSL H7-0756 TaxID=2954738 RepID=UPI0030FB602E
MSHGYRISGFPHGAEIHQSSPCICPDYTQAEQKFRLGNVTCKHLMTGMAVKIPLAEQPLSNLLIP